MSPAPVGQTKTQGRLSKLDSCRRTHGADLLGNRPHFAHSPFPPHPRGRRCVVLFTTETQRVPATPTGQTLLMTDPLIADGLPPAPTGQTRVFGNFPFLPNHNT